MSQYKYYIRYREHGADSGALLRVSTADRLDEDLDAVGEAYGLYACGWFYIDFVPPGGLEPDEAEAFPREE